MDASYSNYEALTIANVFEVQNLCLIHEAECKVAYEITCRVCFRFRRSFVVLWYVYYSSQVLLQLELLSPACSRCINHLKPIQRLALRKLIGFKSNNGFENVTDPVVAIW